LHAGKKALQNKWVYRLKEEDGDKKQYTTIIVCRWQGCGLVASGRVVKAFVLLSRSRVQTSSYLEARLAGGVVLPRGYKAAVGFDPMSREPDTAVVTNSPRYKKKTTEASKEKIWLQRFIEEFRKQ
jgi:hypothetical protein